MFNPNDAGIGLVMLLTLFTAFVAMTRYNISQALALPLVACLFLGLQGHDGESVLRNAFASFSDIAVLFTAVAIPAHMIERSAGFQWISARLGRHLGYVLLSRPSLALPMLTVIMLLATYLLAGMMHNVTAILIVTPVIIRLCDSYGLPSRWLLCGSLIASNLGGFSTKWGDTPNIIESRVWGLATMDFTREVLPANLIALTALVLFVVGLTMRTMVRTGGASTLSAVSIARITTRFNEPVVVNGRLLLVGLMTLGGFIVGQAIWPGRQIAAGTLTILAAVLLEHHEDRMSSLESLGFEVYLTFAAVFVVSGCMEASWVGETLQKAIRDSGASPWAITTTGYFGTLLSEAASWATAAAGRIHPLDGSHTAAWSLGGGICAGSSSILTAASAGIILHEESRRFKDGKHAITFRRYLGFGLAFSLFMLVFYTTWYSVVRFR